jgi:GTP cyclohydrolase II
VPDLIEFCGAHGMKMLTVAELIRYRMQHERYVHRVGEAMVETEHGDFRLIAYESEVDGGGSHMALIRGDISDSSEPVLVRMHAHCLLGDVFGATGCDCNQTLEASLKIIAAEDRGALIYLHQTSRGFAAEKIGEQSFLTFHRERRMPSLPESERKIRREIGLGAQILSDLNLKRIRLLTNHPRRVAGLEGFDIEIVEQIPVKFAAATKTHPEEEERRTEKNREKKRKYKTGAGFGRRKNISQVPDQNIVIRTSLAVTPNLFRPGRPVLRSRISTSRQIERRERRDSTTRTASVPLSPRP